MRILETTNPIYHQPPQIAAHAKRYVTTLDRNEAEYLSEGSRSMASGLAQVDDRWFGDHKNMNQSREPEPRPMMSSIWIADEAPDAPLWLILDKHEGCVFARVRGSLPWIVSQMQLLAGQLGGQVNDLYYRRAPNV